MRNPVHTMPAHRTRALANAVAGAMVSLGALSLASSASAQMRLISDGPQIELRDLAARVVVTPEDRSDIDIRVRYGKAKVPTLMVSHRGNVTVLNGHLSAQPPSFGNFTLAIKFDDIVASNGSVEISGLGKVDVEDLPLVFIRVPNNAVVKDSGYSVGHINPSKSLDMIMNGSGDWSIDPVAGPLNIIDSGSGNIHVTSAGDGIIDNMGSGDIVVDSMRNLKLSMTGSGGFSTHQALDTDIQNQGSGDVSLRNVRAITAKLNGSGDLILGDVTSGLTLINCGSSDVSADKVVGQVSLNLAGSGDVDITAGQIPGFVMRGSGSGDVSFGGIAGNVNIDSNGSGDILISRATGAVVTKVNGSGEMHIGH